MRRVGIVLGAFVLLLVVALVAGYVALQQVDWNGYKEPIAEAAYEATGRRLDLSGDLDLQIGLRPGVRLTGIRFANADWGTRSDMAILEHVLIRFRLLPLLSGELAVGRVEIEGLDLLLETDAEGVPNWEFSVEQAPSSTGSSGEPPEDEPAQPSGTADAGDDPELAERPMAMLLHHAEIRNAQVVIRDGATGEEQRIAIDRLLAQAEARELPLRLELEARYGDSPIQLKGEVEGLPELMAGGSLDLDFSVEAGGAQLAVLGNIGEPLAGTDLDLDLELTSHALGGLSALAGSEIPDLGPLRIELNLSGGGARYEIRDLAVEIGSTRIGGLVDAQLDGDRPRIDAWLTAPRIDAADLTDPSAQEARRVRPAPGIQLVSQSSGKQRLFSEEPLGLDGLKTVDAAVRLDAEKLVANANELEQLGLELVLEAARLDISELAFGLAGGRVDARVQVDASRPTPTLSLVGKARGVSAGRLAASAGSEVIEDGPVDLDFDLRGRGASLAAIMASLDGTFEVSMGRAILRDEYAAMALSDLGSIVSQGLSDEAELDCIYGDFRIAKGVARPEGLVVHLGSIALFGEGKIDLGRERMKLEFDRQAQEVAASGALPPFTLKGPLADPSPGIDTSALLGHVVDLGADLVGSSEKRSHETVSGCRQLLARYQREQDERGSTADVARKAASDLGDKAGKTGKKIADKLKGWLR